VAGGVVLGILQTFAGATFSAGYKDAVALVVLLLVLYFRPTGIFGSSLTETAD
jgi:branched-chain amino acid transport system permease protein